MNDWEACGHNCRLAVFPSAAAKVKPSPAPNADQLEARYQRVSGLDMDYLTAITDVLALDATLRPALSFRTNTSVLTGRLHGHATPKTTQRMRTQQMARGE
jgi:hypothetical protein